MPQTNVDQVNIYSPSELAIKTSGQVQAQTHYVSVYPATIAAISDLSRVDLVALITTLISDNVGGGPPSYYQNLPFTTAIRFDSYINHYNPVGSAGYVITGPLTFTKVTTNAKPGRRLFYA